jgi:hypothetical protein
MKSHHLVTSELYNKPTFNLLTQKHKLTERQHDRQDRQENKCGMVRKVMLGGLLLYNKKHLTYSQQHPLTGLK